MVSLLLKNKIPFSAALCLMLVLGCTDAVMPGPIEYRDYEPGSLTKIPGVNAPYDYLEDYDAAEIVENELVVRLKSFADESALKLILEERGLVDIDAGSSDIDDDGMRRLRFSQSTNLDEVYEYLRDSDDIDFVEPNIKISAIDVPNDPMWQDQWGPQKIGSQEAWTHLPASPRSYLIAVIDTGIDYTHPDLQDAMWQNEGEIPDNQIDDDGNGYVDDVYGYDFVNFDSDPYDDHYHGTHCAGIIGASHNETGIVGVAPHVQLVGLKFLAANGYGNSYGAMRSVKYANDMNIPITNNSWGGGPYSAALYSEIARSEEQGAIFVAAAGNNNRNTDQSIYYPMGYALSNVVSVGSSTSSDSRSWFSNYGQTTVDLFAPGSNILSTFPNNSYSSISGTSMAAPHVAGALAVLWAALPSQTDYGEIINGLLNHVEPVEAFAAQSVTGGRLNLLKAMRELADTIPATPVGLGVVAGVESDLLVTWQPSDEEDVGGYRIYFGTEPDNFASVDVDASTIQHRLTNLSNDQTYFIELSALSARGTPSEPTERLSGIPTDGIAPAGILNLTAYVESGLQLPVSLLASSGDYGEDWDGVAAIDSNTNTAWSAPILTESIEHDLLFSFENESVVGQIRIYHGDGFVHYFPASFDVEVSMDGTDWVTVVSESGYNAEPGIWGVWNLSAESATLVRFRVTQPQGHENGLFYAVLPEIGFYESASAQNAAELSWSATGDDGFSGTATAIDLRYSETPITASNFETASVYAEVDAPQISGSLEQLRVDGLMPEREYYFALVAEDEAGNRSPVSNLASVTTLGLPPSAISDLRALQVGETSVTLGWTSPGDDGNVGQAALYDLRHSTTRLHSGTFLQGNPVQMAVPEPAGFGESIEILNLLPQTNYFFALRTVDDSGQTSVLSNVLQVTTGNLDDEEPPSDVSDLWAYIEELQGTEVGIETAQSNGDYPGDWDVSNLIDGATGSAWASSAITNNVTQAEVIFTLAGSTPSNVAGVRLTPYEGFLDLFPQTFRIETSLDGVIYVPVAGRTGQPRLDEPLEIVFENEEARFVKLIVNEVSPQFNNQFAVISEFEVFSPAGNGFEVVLNFTAPGDDAHIGQAARYDIRYGTQEITESTFGVTPILLEASPHLSGTLEAYRFSELMGETDYYFALKSLDDQNNWSGVSNIAWIQTPPIPPAAVVDLRAQGGPGYIDVTWTAPGDNGREGQAALYELRWSTEPITPYNFNSAFIVPNTPIPGMAGSNESYRHNGLDSEEKIYFGLKTTDANSNTSLISNVVYAVSWDVLEPATITDLTLSLVNDENSQYVLEASFSASGDDWLNGDVSGYELYVHTSFIQDSNLSQATMYTLGLGEIEKVLVGLPLETEHYVVVRAFDNQPNYGAFSGNVAAYTAGIPPGPISDFAATNVGVSSAILSWTATGDDDLSGSATVCEISITTGATALPFITIDNPVAGGMIESQIVSTLAGNTDYEASVSCWDDRNQKVQSNTISFRTDDGEAPAQITDLVLQRGDTPGLLAMSWTATGDNGSLGTATLYEIRYREGTSFAEGDFASQLLYTSSLVPAEGGSLESLSFSLATETLYCFALLAIDDKGLKGDVSNIVCADSGWEAPGAVTDLAVTDVDRVDVTLAWTASGDNGGQGQAQTTDLRYATQVITEDNWDDAVSATLEPPPSLSGQPEAFTVTALNGATTYYFALKTEDDKGLFSPLSNVVSIHTEDTIPPAPVLDLAAAKSNVDGIMILSWTASGENGNEGSAQSVEIRYQDGNESTFSWASATALDSVPGAGAAGLSLTAYAQSLVLETTYCFAVKTTDTVGNVSDISNIACAETQESPPAQITDLMALGSSAETVVLQWTAPGASVHEGQAESYELRYHSAQITVTNWSDTQLVNIVPQPGMAGSPETVSVSGLAMDTPYYFAIKTTDERGNTSVISVNAVGETLDDVAPAPVTDLTASAGSLNGMVVLNWTAVGDSLQQGRASSYDIRYSTEVIDDSNFESASSYAYVLTPKTVGQIEQATLSSLSYETSYYFAVKAIDESGNASPLGQTASADTAEVLPARVTSLAVTEIGVGQLSLRWTASGDDGIQGIATAYDLRVSTSTLTDATWESATPVSDEPEPQAYGLIENFLLTGLEDDTLYYVGLRVVDDRGNVSAISNIASAQTEDVLGPAAVSTLVAQPPLGDGGIIAVNTVVSSSSYSVAWPTHHLNDGDTSTSWASQISAEADTETLTLDWGDSKEVGAINLFATKDYEHLFPKDFVIELSEDGSNWVSVANEVNFEAVTGFNRWSFDGVPATQMRIQMTDFGTIASQYIAMLSEIEIEETTPDPTLLHLRWLAVGDDGDDGTATAYEIRYSDSLITASNFSAAQLFDASLNPRGAGRVETATLTSLNPETTYYIAMRVQDEVLNESALSNVASATTRPEPPQQVQDLGMENALQNQLELVWTAPGDNGAVGQAQLYEIRLSSQSITLANFESATLIDNIPSPGVAGAEERLLVTGLNAGTSYYVALKTQDSDGHWSQLSNIFVAQTAAGPDTLSPDPITSLSVSLPSGDVPTIPVISSVSGAQFPDGQAALLLDGQMGTDWYTPARETMQAEEVIIDLGVEVLLEEVVMTASSFFPEHFPQSYDIELSLDGTNYQLVASGSASNIVSNAQITHSFAATQAQYIRLSINALASGSNGLFYLALAELEFVQSAANDGKALLTWVATGDDHSAGTANSYEVRYSQSSIDESNWEASTLWMDNVPTPSPAGALETCTLSGLEAGTLYYFTVIALDEDGNSSGLSNVTSVNIP